MSQTARRRTFHKTCLMPFLVLSVPNDEEKKAGRESTMRRERGNVRETSGKEGNRRDGAIAR